MNLTKTLLVLAVGSLAGQQLVVNRKIASIGAPETQKIERLDGGFIGDSFRIGAAGEVWMIDSIRVWAAPDGPPSCYTGLTLMGALDNPPVPSQPPCDCHALMALSKKASVKAASGPWQIDFTNLNWSVPGATDVVFSVRATSAAKPACGSASWSLSVAPATPGYRLHKFSKGAVPEGLAETREPPRWINVQVWARRL